MSDDTPKVRAPEMIKWKKPGNDGVKVTTNSLAATVKEAERLGWKRVK